MATLQFYHEKWKYKIEPSAAYYRLTFAKSLHRSVDYVLSIVFCQGNSIAYKSRQSLKIQVGLWLLTMIVVIYGYTGTLTAYLTLPKWMPTVSTAQDLASRDDIHFTVESDNELYYKINVANFMQREVWAICINI